jgi:hypothetical protein
MKRNDVWWRTGGIRSRLLFGSLLGLVLCAGMPAHATVMRGIDTEVPVAAVEESGESEEDQAVNAYLQSCLAGLKQVKGCDALRQEAVPIIKEDVLTLGASADPAQLPVLVDILQSDEADLRVAAADAIGMIGPTPAETPALMIAFNDRIPTVRSAAYMALEQSRDPATKSIVDKGMIALARTGAADDTETFQTVLDHFTRRRDDSQHLKEAFNYIVDPAYLKELEQVASDRGNKALAQEEKVFSPTINLKVVAAEQPSRSQLELAHKWFAFFAGSNGNKVVERAKKRGDFLALDEQEPPALQAAILYYELADDQQKIDETKGKADKLGDTYAKKEDFKRAIAYYQIAENNEKMKELEDLQENRVKKQLKEMQKDESQQKQFKKEQNELEKELGF